VCIRIARTVASAIKWDPLSQCMELVSFLAPALATDVYMHFTHSDINSLVLGSHRNSPWLD